MNKISPLKAIRLKCLDCCCGSSKMIQTCGITDCSLWTFRSGKTGRIGKKSILTEEQRRELGQRLKTIRLNKLPLAKQKELIPISP